MRRWSQLSLSTRILIGLGVGLLAGLFFGERTAPLQVVADVYLRLMQMTVIPYVSLALITGLGQLELAKAKALAMRGGLLLLLLWSLCFLVLALMPLSFPDLQSASFFSSAMVEPRRSFDFVGLYIPDNPFHALANGVVPAVVLFSAAVGVALIGVERKDGLIRQLRVLLEALTRVTKFVLRLTPLGVLAIGAVAAGSMTIEELSRLQVYFVTFFVAALVLAFWVLPFIVTALTPFRYWDVVGVAKDALLTAFVTNNVFIVLPILAEEGKRLIRKYELQAKHSEALVDVIIPVAFNFPTVGKLLTLLFVPYAAWLSGQPLELAQYPGFFLTGLLSYFAKAQTALPFLMDLMKVPHDLFQLYIPTTLLTGKLDSLVGAMHLLVLGLLGAGAMVGWLSFKPARVARAVLGVAAGVLAIVFGTRLLLASTVDTSYDKGAALKSMQLLRRPADAIVHREPPPDTGTGESDTRSGLERIRARGTLRLGYTRDRLPLTFFNADDELVGFDVELGAKLAEDLGVRPELVPVEWARVTEQLDSGAIDVVLSVPYVKSWLSSMTLSTPYLDGTMGFAVRDERRHEFRSIESMQRLSGLRLGVPVDPELMKQTVDQYLPGVRIEPVVVGSLREFFEGRVPDVDALLVAAEVGMAWTLLHPEFSVVVPQPRPVRVPMAYAVRSGDYELVEFLNEWLLLQRSYNTVERAYDYWVLGRGTQARRPRWSVLRDVLGWVD